MQSILPAAPRLLCAAKLNLGTLVYSLEQLRSDNGTAGSHSKCQEV